MNKNDYANRKWEKALIGKMLIFNLKNMLTKNLRKYFVLLKDWREINITEWQKEMISEWIRDRVQFIEIYDADTKEVLYAWKANNIEEIRERKFSWEIYNAVCDFWNRHHIFDWKFECNCEKKYKFMAISFKMYMCREKNKMYESDYTEDDRMEFQEIQRQKGKLIKEK